MKQKVESLENSQKRKDEAFKKKVNNLENKITTILRAIEKKDTQISALETQIQDMENTVNKLQEESNQHLETSIRLTEDTINCQQCNFTTMSKQGLKTHIKRKHTILDTEAFPKICDFCDRKFDNINQMKFT